MQRRIEVNLYRFRYRPRLATRRFIVLCESCRINSDLSLDVQEFGAEMNVASLECSECGYVMNNPDVIEPQRLRQRPESRVHEPDDDEFQVTRAMQRERILRRRKFV